MRIGVGSLVVAVLVVGGSAATVAAKCVKTRDPFCVQAVEQPCKDANPCGGAAFDECIGDCEEQTFCSAIVTCVKACYARRTAARAQCHRDRQACIRRECPKRCVPPPGALTAPIVSGSCVRKCRRARATCQEKRTLRRFVRGVCIDYCQDKCGAFQGQFPQALGICLADCPDPPDLECKADFEDCKAACDTPTTTTTLAP